MFGLMGNLDPEEQKALKAALFQAGMGLMASKDPNLGRSIGNAGLMGVGAYHNAQSLADRRKQEAQEREARSLMMQQARQQQEQAAQRNQALQGLMSQRPELAQLFQVAPDKAIDRAFPKPNMQIAPNGQAVDMNSVQPGQSFAKQPDWMDPRYQEFALRRAREGASRVTVDSRQENEFSKAVGKQQGEDYSNLMKSDAMASSQLNKLGRLESLLASSGNTGKLTPPTMELKAVADSLGFKVDPKLPFQQAAQALSNEIALTLRNPAGGAGMPGALSDKDREFLTNMVPNLSKTPEGNKMLIDTMKKLAIREKEVAKLARDYRKRNGKFDEAFYDELAQFSAKNPLFQQPQAQPSLADIEAEILRRRQGATRP